MPNNKELDRLVDTFVALHEANILSESAVNNVKTNFRLLCSADRYARQFIPIEENMSTYVKLYSIAKQILFAGYCIKRSHSANALLCLRRLLLIDATDILLDMDLNINPAGLYQRRRDTLAELAEDLVIAKLVIRKTSKRVS